MTVPKDSSFTSYGGYGFWAGNVYMQTWLCVLVEQIDGLAACPAWLLEARDNWAKQGQIANPGAMIADLDIYVVDQARREQLVGLSNGAVERLRRFGQTIPIEYLRAIGAEPKGTMFLRPLQTAPFIAYGEKWLVLLRGDPEITSSKNPDRIMVDPRKMN